MHTENSHLCEIITNFAGGIAALNGLTANTQYLATGTSGTDFAISSLSDTHTFNLPTASATNRGALSSADWSTFNGKASGNIYTTDGTLTADRTITSNGNSLTILGGKETFAGYQRALWLKTSTTGKNSVEIVLENTFTTTGKVYEIASYSDGTFNITDRSTATPKLKIDSNFVQFNTGTSNLFATVSGLNALWIASTIASATTSNYSLAIGGGFIVLNAPTGNGISFRIGNTERATLTAAGRLLLGTTSEGTYILDVNGNTRITGEFTQGGTNNANLGYIRNTSVGVATFASPTLYAMVIGTVSNAGHTATFTKPNSAGTAIRVTGQNIDTTPNYFLVDYVGSAGFNLPNGTTTANASAQVEIISTTKGFLPPRMTTTQKNAIGTPAQGLMVFDTTLVKLCVYNGTAWETITSI